MGFTGFVGFIGFAGFIGFRAGASAPHGLQVALSARQELKQSPPRNTKKPRNHARALKP